MYSQKPERIQSCPNYYILYASMHRSILILPTIYGSVSKVVSYTEKTVWAFLQCMHTSRPSHHP
jgi:hypothetical protein